MSDSPGTIRVVVKAATPNPTNNRQHRWVLQKRANTQKIATRLALADVAEADRVRLADGCLIRLTRVSAGRVDKMNLHSCLKHVADQVAQWLLGGRIGEKDDDERIEWDCKQEKGKPRQPAVVVELIPAKPNK